MTIFVNASALTSIIANEADATALESALDADPVRLCSALSLWETMAGLRKSYGLPPSRAREQVSLYRQVGDLTIVDIGEREFDLAAEAYEKFGKGRHSAALNMGDCFAYACAKANRAKLLCKGGDFSFSGIDQAKP